MAWDVNRRGPLEPARQTVSMTEAVREFVSWLHRVTMTPNRCLADLTPS